MKRFVMTLLAGVCCVAMTWARDTEVSASYGAAPAMCHIASMHNHWDGMDNCWGTVNFTIDHRFLPHLWVGMGYTFSTADSDTASEGRYGKVTWHGLMVNARYEWLSRPKMRLYSHVGVGALVAYYSPSWEDSYNSNRFAFQVMPIGIEADVCRNVGVFAELGYGIQGVGKAGIRVGF